MATFFFRAVAIDGRMRTGSLSGDNEKTITRELRKQGLTPVYVGVAPKGSSLQLKMPSFGGGKRKDVLFFTQELSTLLNASVPLDRAISITAELTDRPWGLRDFVVQLPSGHQIAFGERIGGGVT